MRVDPSLSTFRLARRLASTHTLPAVCSAFLEHVIHLAPSRFGSIAVPAESPHQAVIAATHGYPFELVAHLRIPHGQGVIGSVFAGGMTMNVADARTSTLHTPRSRYRTHAFLAVPIKAGSDVLAVVCLTDRVAGGTYTREDIARLRVAAAPAALALSREYHRRHVDRLANAANLDPITGLFNRRYFEVRLTEELSRAERQRVSVSLVMIDVDAFKSINDRYGHLVGDAVVRNVADVVRGSLRVSDISCRFGGDEFAVIMPATDADGAYGIAERVRRRIESLRTASNQFADLQPTISIGIAAGGAGTSPQDLIRAADAALYRAKRQGKNIIAR